MSVSYTHLASDTRQQVNDLQSQTNALRGQLGSIVAQLEQSRTELAEADVYKRQPLWYPAWAKPLCPA